VFRTLTIDNLLRSSWNLKLKAARWHVDGVTLLGA